MRWSPQQDAALTAVSRWLRDRDRPYFYLAGYAGTGKTTLARELSQGVGCAMFAAFTGKAAHVMRQAGCPNARTIHSLIYRPAEKSREHLRKLEAHLAAVRGRLDNALTGPETAALEREVRQTEENIALERENLQRPSWSLNLESDLRAADLLVIDECSMVDQQMGEDLLSFGVPLLVLGDPAQLPPVRGTGFFTQSAPDVMLTEIHRQALESPVLWLATEVRQGRALSYGQHGTSRVCDSISPEEVLAADQILVGLNATRHVSNRRVRHLRGLEGPYPRKDERLVCLRNNSDLGLLNGAIYRSTQDAVGDPEWVNLRLVPEEGGEPVLVSAHPEPFLGLDLRDKGWGRRDAEEFDFGYCLTVHKSQGSAFPSVVLFDEWCFDDRQRWLYTGISRASEKVVVVRR